MNAEHSNTFPKLSFFLMPAGGSDARQSTGTLWKNENMLTFVAKKTCVSRYVVVDSARPQRD